MEVRAYNYKESACVFHPFAFYLTLGDCNPHESVDWFMHLSLEKRLTVLQALCEAVLVYTYTKTFCFMLI